MALNCQHHLTNLNQQLLSSREWRASSATVKVAVYSVFLTFRIADCRVLKKGEEIMNKEFKSCCYCPPSKVVCLLVTHDEQLELIFPFSPTVT